MAEFMIHCPRCGCGLVASDEFVGQKVKCPRCDDHFVVGEPEHVGIDDACDGASALDETDGPIRDCVPVATLTLMAASILATVVMFLKTGELEPDIQSYVAFGANFKPLTFGGQFWRLATSAFLHFGLKHLAMNMLCLLSLGSVLEKIVGRVKIFEIYFLTAVVGGVFSCVFHPDSVCAGASGAVFGLFGAEMACLTLLREELGMSTNDMIRNIKGGLVFVGINLAYSLLPGIDMSAHVGGLVMGLVTGAAIACSLKKESAFAWFQKGSTAVSVLVAIMLAVTVRTGRDAGRLSLPELTAKVSDMIAGNLARLAKENGAYRGTFKVRDLSLEHEGGNRYQGKVEIDFEVEGSTYPLRSRITVEHDCMGTSYEMSEEDRANWGKSVRMPIDALERTVSQMLTEKIVKGIEKDGGTNVSARVLQLSLVHEGGDRYHGHVEMEYEYDGETEYLKCLISVKYDGTTVSYALRPGGRDGR